MDRVEIRTEARELLDQLYMTAIDGRDSGRARLAELARAARSGGAPLAEHAEGPWRSDRCRSAHTAGGEHGGGITCVMRGEFELPLPEQDASDVAALLNWAEVPEPGAQT
jgi:hypothetical protein